MLFAPFSKLLVSRTRARFDSRFCSRADPRASTYGLVALAACLLLGGSACDDGSSCSDEELVAIELHVTVPEGQEVSKITAELLSEEECGFFDQGLGRVYTCWEQGHDSGVYKVRIYAGETVVYTEDDEVKTDGCHVTQRFISEIDLTSL